MTPDVRAFLAVVLDAIDLPSPATVGDHEAFSRLLEDRALDAAVALRVALDESLVGGTGLDWHTAYLREQLAKKPPTGYRHHVAADGGGRS